ncbi:MAG: shikimate kinase [Bacteroidetes bacterium]|nr:shikimate kinase [Bacteroidota bacterium]
MSNKIIFILIGPKGSGKTHIGSLIKRQLGIKFFRVEDVWLKLVKEQFSDAYIQKGFSLVEQELDEKLKKTDRIIIESTAAHEEFHNFLARLRKKYNIKLVKISAPLDLCLNRTISRDQTIHIPVSDNRVEEINRKAFSVDLPFDLVIENDKRTDKEIVEIFLQFYKCLNSTSYNTK